MKGTYLIRPPEAEAWAVGEQTDVILRKNIEECEETDENGTTTVWQCDEAQGRVAGNLSAAQAAENFDALWAKLTIGDGVPNAEDRLAALEDAMMAVMRL